MHLLARFERWGGGSVDARWGGGWRWVIRIIGREGEEGGWEELWNWRKRDDGEAKRRAWAGEGSSR